MPEGALRTFISQSIGVPEHREADLLKHLGLDLPGAVEVFFEDGEFGLDEKIESELSYADLRFSLAGVQLKFSANWSDQHHLTIPAKGMGGDWIIKMPFKALAEKTIGNNSIVDDIISDTVSQTTTHLQEVCDNFQVPDFVRETLIQHVNMVAKNLSP